MARQRGNPRPESLQRPVCISLRISGGRTQAWLASASANIDGALHPSVIDCSIESPWGFQKALAQDGLVVALEERASAPSIPGWPAPPREAAVLPIRLHERSEAAGFLVLGLHPGRAFDDTYRQFVRRIAEQMPSD